MTLFENLQLLHESDNSVITICYNKKKKWSNRQDAIDFFYDGMMSTEGSESDRYKKIYSELISGEKLCTDLYDDEYSLYNIEEDFDVTDTNQKYTSAKTSINSSRLPAIFKMIDLSSGTINLDFGGGRFDNVAEFYSDKGVTNLVYDPYNRSSKHNNEVLAQIRKNGGADSVTCSNVLNVIAEPDARITVIKNIYNLAKSGAPCYFTVYEGSGSGEGAETKSGYQLNKKTVDYLAEIQEVFPNVKRKGKLIIATK